ncbi:MAG: hypothetical protein WBB30_00295 [Solirubrobacterales bacterium]
MASKSSKRRRKQRRRQGAPPQQQQQSEPLEAAPARPPAAARRSTARARRGNIEDEPPQAPWGSFPLVELAIFVGIVMLILGLLVVGGSRGSILIVTGLALASIGGLELSIREHFAGYRSHTAILAGVSAAVVLGLLYTAGPDGLPPIVRAGIGAAVFALAAVALTRVFSARSGGYAFRFSSLKRRQ